jgi:hypothetical protein
LKSDVAQWRRFQPHPAQQRVLVESARFNVLDCGRRFGKTELGMDRAIDGIKRGLPVAWYAPTYKDAMDVWRDLKSILYSVTVQKNEQEKRLEVVTGGAIEVWTLNDPNSSRGRKYGRVIIDEAAKIQHLDMAWNETIRPTLTDLKGDAWFLSTPKGRNFFWALYRRGHDIAKYPDWRSWKMPTTANPFIDAEEVESARRELPERAFMQEYLAEFTEDGGAVFRNISACVGQVDTTELESRDLVAGADWGKDNDFTVITILDRNTGECVGMDRFNGIGWSLQRGRLRAVYDEFKPGLIIAEENSIGGPNIEALQAEGLPVQPFMTTGTNKGPLIESLALAFERGEITIPDDPIVISELQSYTMERLPSGRFRYGAPSGMHDDTVIALALAWRGANIPTRLIGFI